MNEMELHYTYHNRSNELMAEAEADRLRREARRARSTDGRSKGLAARVSNALRRKERPPAGSPQRARLAE